MKDLFSIEGMIAEEGAGKMPVGIYEKCSLTSKFITRDGVPTLIVTFRNQKQEVASKYFEEPTLSTVRTWEDQTPEEALPKELRKQLTILAKYAIELTSVDLAVKIKGTSHENWLQKFDEFFKKHSEGNFLNLKIIANNSGNPTIPYGTYGYFEKWVEGKPSKLSFTTKEKAKMDNPTKATDEVNISKNLF